MKDVIVKILMESFSSVYCDTWKNDEIDNICENCHRKSINWGISESYAKSIASYIVNNKLNKDSKWIIQIK